MIFSYWHQQNNVYMLCQIIIHTIKETSMKEYMTLKLPISHKKRPRTQSMAAYKFVKKYVINKQLN
ncbi:hypothetical protein Cylst_0579 [Cylindrospermum stagnale PCC 7417]|uniref:Uncharacterized protein n=1 Tax=Cylindrospermum stagnale PCC 7417 TaxID=56107 RepID=K9WTN4_9NOST|nr:hypothetical protein Cylst_0579 [Cylindrospermum stagnale PCC 7417]